jgi:hypothetical protein
LVTLLQILVTIFLHQINKSTETTFQIILLLYYYFKIVQSLGEEDDEEEDDEEENRCQRYIAHILQAKAMQLLLSSL